jgi:HJR/Mrr/RecB family endonuclease
MRPDEYEHIVASYFEQKGFLTKVSQYTNDYGVDVFAVKGDTKIAIQAKMFGGSTRSINRQMVMELHGAKDYFDCTKAIIATNGRVLITSSTR